MRTIGNFWDKCDLGAEEAFAPICQRKNVEFIEDPCLVGCGWEESVEVFLANTSREEGGNPEELPNIGV